MTASWEKSLIGSILSDPAKFEIAEELLPSDFTGANMLVWAELKPLAIRNGLDARGLANALENSTDAARLRSQAGMPIEDYLAQLIGMAGNTVIEYKNQVLDASVKRSLKHGLALIAAEADGSQRKADELLDFAEKKILSLRRIRSDEGISMADLFGSYIPRLEGMRAGTVKPAWTPNMTALREVIPFFEASDYAIVASRPGKGKSSILRMEALRTAYNGQFVGFFNLENDQWEYAKHFISMALGIDNAKLKDPKRLSPNELSRVKEIAEELARMPLRLIHAAGWSVQQIIRAGRKMVAEQDMQLMCVDYLQLIRNGKQKANEDIEETSSLLRAFSLQMNVPQLNAAQVARTVDTRGNDEDMVLSDLRGSGSLEQDASIIVFPRCPWRTIPDEADMRKFPENVYRTASGEVYCRPTCVPMQLDVAKNRNGDVAKSGWMKWNRSTNRFTMLDRDWMP